MSLFEKGLDRSDFDGTSVEHEDIIQLQRIPAICPFASTVRDNSGSCRPIRLSFALALVVFGAAQTALATSVPTVSQVSSSNNHITLGGSTTLTALVNTGGHAPTGTVTFSSNGTSLGSPSVSTVSTTNLVPNSSQIGGSSWSAYCGSTSNMTLNTSAVLAPDGSQTATSFALPSSFSCGAAGTWGALISVAGGLTAGQTYTVSVWLEGANGGEVVSIQPNDCLPASVTLTNTWQRYSITFPSISSAAASCSTGVRGFEMKSQTPDATYYAWGAQTEKASSAGPYVATITVSASGSGGVATLATSVLTEGSDSVLSTYNGDSSDGTSSSPPITLAVTKANVTEVYASNNPITVGGSETFTALIDTGGNPPTGTVSFTSNGSSIGTAPVAAETTTNLVPESQQMGGTGWTGYCAGSSENNITLNTSDLSAPDGSQTATKIVIPSSFSCGAGPAWGTLNTVSGGLTAGQSYTVSVWMRGTTAASGIQVGLNDCLNAGITLTTSWKRYVFKYADISSTVAQCSSGIRGFELMDNSVPNLTVYLWGPQVEQSSDVGPYIATSNAAASGSGGVASLTTNSLAQGSDSIVGSYGGDSYDLASTSSTWTETVNAASPTGGTYDTGTITLTVNGSTAASMTYGSTATASSVAAGLVSGIQSGAPVSLTAVDNTLYINATGQGSGTDYSYTLQTTSWNSSLFPNPSFLNPAVSGSLDGGSGTTGSSVSVYGLSRSYDGVGNALTSSETLANGKAINSWTSTYDTLNRLASSTVTQTGNPNTNYCWGYDGFGNRTIQAASNAAFTTGSPACTPQPSATLASTWANYNLNNQVVGTAMAPNGLGYDASGDVTYDGVNSYLYDGEGRICAVSSTPVPGMTSMVGYLYDANGTRIAKGSIKTWGSCDPTINGFQIQSDYVLGPSGEQVTEMGMDSSGTMAWQHTNAFLGGSPIATYDSNGIHFYVNDPLGSRRVQLDYEGVVEQYCTNLPFGDGLTCSASLTSPTEQHFTGKERDAESGNDYFFARYYSSAMGRFMSPDWSAKQEPVPYAKLDNPQSLNLYAYVLNNPLTHVDPDGHDCHTFLGITVCFGKPAPLPPPPPTPKPPPVPPPPPLKFKPNVPVPAPNSNLGKLLQCTNNCMNPVPIGVSSTSETVPGHPEIHGPDTPHGRGEAADLIPGKSEAKPTLWCSAQCGAGFGQNEYDHPSAHATGAHDHVQTGEGRGGSRGDLPANEHPEQPQE